MRVAPLDRSHLAAAELVLADACAFDRATEVADEKLFAPGPTAPALAFGAWNGDELVGVAAVSSKWLRVIAVVPRARGKGAGSALLAACEAAARGAGETRLRTLDQPGNYLAPGIDERNEYLIGWLERRGYARSGEPRSNVLIDVRNNPRVSAERAVELARVAATKGYEVRRARSDERALLEAVAKEFGGAWPWELERALAYDPPGVHVAVLMEPVRGTRTAGDATTDGATIAGATTGGAATTTTVGSTTDDATAGATTGGATTTTVVGSTTDDATDDATAGATTGGATTTTGGGASTPIYCAFAAHDGNNRGLGWFGPTGTWPAHRGKGLGEALLMACLVDVGREHARCEVAWIGPRPFYDKVAGIVEDRRFVLLARELT